MNEEIYKQIAAAEHRKDFDTAAKLRDYLARLSDHGEMQRRGYITDDQQERRFKRGWGYN